MFAACFQSLPTVLCCTRLLPCNDCDVSDSDTLKNTTAHKSCHIQIFPCPVMMMGHWTSWSRPMIISYIAIRLMASAYILSMTHIGYAWRYAWHHRGPGLDIHLILGNPPRSGFHYVHAACSMKEGRKDYTSSMAASAPCAQYTRDKFGNAHMDICSACLVCQRVDDEAELTIHVPKLSATSFFGSTSLRVQAATFGGKWTMPRARVPYPPARGHR